MLSCPGAGSGRGTPAVEGKGRGRGVRASTAALGRITGAAAVDEEEEGCADDNDNDNNNNNNDDDDDNDDDVADDDDGEGPSELPPWRHRGLGILTCTSPSRMELTSASLPAEAPLPRRLLLLWTDVDGEGGAHCAVREPELDSSLVAAACAGVAAPPLRRLSVAVVAGIVVAGSHAAAGDRRNRGVPAVASSGYAAARGSAQLRRLLEVLRGH